MLKKIESIPGAKRTINALRDIGYDLNSAVADILDNSISGGNATNIYIEFNKNKNGEFHFYIADDGLGMNTSFLEEAMRIGSSNDDYSKGNLSKYGMGMKTASMSQASKITVISKKRGSQNSAYRWDLDHVEKTDQWEIFELSKNKIFNIKNRLIEYGQYDFETLFSLESWTIVIWEDLADFQKNYDSRSSNVVAENYFNKICDNLETYLRLVFHRFIVGENSAKKTSIFLNSTKLEALDPFCRSETHTKEIKLHEKHGNYVIKEDSNPIVIKRYILPTNPRKPGDFVFSSIDAWEEAKGTLSWNESQGYYVYRNNRLISWGGWFRTKALDEHDKLARASIDLTDEHDDLFTLDVKKTRVQFPEDLRNHLKDNINKNFISEAKKRYNQSEKKKAEIKNTVRGNSKRVSYLASELVKEDNITVMEGLNNIGLIINNKYGQKITDDMTYKMLEAGHKIVSMPFDDATFFWRMVPNPYNEFQVIVNTEHPFYDLVYGNAHKDKKTTAIMDAFLFTMSFIELKCITNSNELLFEQIREVASSVLTKFIDEKIF